MIFHRHNRRVWRKRS